MRQPILVLSLCVAALIAAACSSPSAAPASAPAAASSEPTNAAPSVEASSAAPSEAAASASIPVPQFSFPSDDKGLEALIPDSLCGAKVQKLSMKGQTAIGTAAEWPGILAALGKTVDDVSAAAGFPPQGEKDCSVIIIRIKGADEGKLKDLFQQEATKEGKTLTQVSLGGKDVYKTETDKFEYAYVKGDGVIFFGADSEANAASIASALP
jgi:hypothetical protein